MISVVELDREEAAQVAYAIGRGVGHAPARNRLRRRLRHVMQARHEQLERGRAYLVSARAPASGVSFAELDATVGALLSELESGR